MARVDIPDGDGDELTRLFSVNPAMGKVAGTFSMKAYAESTIPVRVRELIRMRIALINHCPI